MNRDIYYKKYLKYRSKYIALKGMTGGGVFCRTCDTTHTNENCRYKLEDINITHPILTTIRPFLDKLDEFRRDFTIINNPSNKKFFSEFFCNIDLIITKFKQRTDDQHKYLWDIFSEFGKYISDDIYFLQIFNSFRTASQLMQDYSMDISKYSELDEVSRFEIFLKVIYETISGDSPFILYKIKKLDDDERRSLMTQLFDLFTKSRLKYATDVVCLYYIKDLTPEQHTFYQEIMDILIIKNKNILYLANYRGSTNVKQKIVECVITFSKDQIYLLKFILLEIPNIDINIAYNITINSEMMGNHTEIILQIISEFMKFNITVRPLRVDTFLSNISKKSKVELNELLKEVKTIYGMYRNDISLEGIERKKIKEKIKLFEEERFIAENKIREHRASANDKILLVENKLYGTEMRDTSTKKFVPPKSLPPTFALPI